MLTEGLTRFSPLTIRNRQRDAKPDQILLKCKMVIVLALPTCQIVGLAVAPFRC